MNDGVGAERDNIFFGERLDAVGDRLKKAVGADAIWPEAILHAAQALALEDGGEREETGKTETIAMTPRTHAGRRLKRGRQESYEPIAQEDEDLVEIYENGIHEEEIRRHGLAFSSCRLRRIRRTRGPGSAVGAGESAFAGAAG